MELFQVFGFLIIMKESVKLLTKTWKFIVPITTLSLILPSALLLLFNNFALSLIRIMFYRPHSRPMYMPLLVLIEFIFILVLFKLSDLLSLVIIHVSSTAYTGGSKSLISLYSGVARTWKNNRFVHESRKLGIHMVLFGGSYCILTFMNLMNRVTICVYLISLIVFVVYTLYSSVPLAVATVVAVVEESCVEGNALERGKELVQGQRHHGFMVNLLDKVVLLVAFVGFWTAMNGDRRVMNLKIYGMFFVNMHSLQRILRSMMWTVFYFRCKKCRVKERVAPGNEDLEYTKLLV